MLTLKNYKYSTIIGAAAITFALYLFSSLIFGINEKDKILQHVTLYTIIATSFLLLKNFRDEIKKSLSTIPKRQALELAICFFIFFFYQVFTTEPPKIDTTVLLDLDKNLVIFLTSAIILSPLVEEILFREIVFKNYIEKSEFKIFWLVVFSIAFSLLHASESFYLIFLLSVSLYSIRIITNSLLLCIIAHSAWNLLFIYTWLFGT